MRNNTLNKQYALEKEVRLTHPDAEWLPDPDSIALWCSADTFCFPECGQSTKSIDRKKLRNTKPTTKLLRWCVEPKEKHVVVSPYLPNSTMGIVDMHWELMEDMVRVMQLTGARSLAGAELGAGDDVICVLTQPATYTFFYNTKFITPAFGREKFNTRSVSHPLDDREFYLHEEIILIRGWYVTFGPDLYVIGAPIVNSSFKNLTTIKAYLTAWHQKEEIYRDYSWQYSG